MSSSSSDFVFYQGDCLSEMTKIDDGSVDLIIADLPYETNYRLLWDKMINMEQFWKETGRVLKEDGVVALTAQQPFTSQLVLSNTDWFRYEWIWDKHIARGMHRAKQQPMRKHESVLIFSKIYKHRYYPIMIPRDKPVTVKNYSKNSKSVGGYVDNTKEYTYTHKNPTTIIEGCWEPNTGRIHPTQKPVSLMEYLIKTFTQEGETVLDPCYGSCSTGVACSNTNRKFIGIEKDEDFYEMGKQRVFKV